MAAVNSVQLFVQSYIMKKGTLVFFFSNKVPTQLIQIIRWISKSQLLLLMTCIEIQKGEIRGVGLIS